MLAGFGKSNVWSGEWNPAIAMCPFSDHVLIFIGTGFMSDRRVVHRHAPIPIAGSMEGIMALPMDRRWREAAPFTQEHS
jgi:hypothetical protein